MEKVAVDFKDRIFICRCTFDARDIPRKAGFRWSIEKRIWFTQHADIAARLGEYATPSAKAEIDRKVIAVKPHAGPLPFPKTEKLMPHQIKSAKFALSRRHSYLALDPGLGKTASACAVLNALYASSGTRGIYVCPPFLVETVINEFERFTTIEKFKAARIDRVDPKIDDVHLVVVPDSIVHRDDVTEAVLKIIKRFRDNFVFMVDEAHRFKNPTAKRTKAVFKTLHPNFARSVCMSGTPMPNRPIELYPVLSAAAPQVIDHMSYPSFGIRYCAGFKGPWGWDFSGASRVDELSSKILGEYMIRFKKSEVLKDLPPKTTSLVLVGENLPARLAEMDRKILSAFSPNDLVKAQISAKVKMSDDELHIATYRRELGVSKVPESLKFIQSILEDTDESMLIFAHHKEVIYALEKGLHEFKPIVVTGDTPTSDRHELVHLFQNSKRRIFLGNIQAAGVGFTLTKAKRVIFVEFSWVPGENDQAADRAHRIGQHDNVLVHFLVYKNSIDRRVLESVLLKQTSIDKL